MALSGLEGRELYAVADVKASSGNLIGAALHHENQKDSEQNSFESEYPP